MSKHNKQTVEELDREQLSADEDTIAVLPAYMFDSAEFSTLGELTNMPMMSVGNGSIIAAHMGRDSPFPCFKKGRWAQEGVVELVQEK